MKAYLQPFNTFPGVFSNEKSIVLEEYNGTKIFGFFDARYICGGKLEVEICKEEDELATVRLPKRTFEISGDKGYLIVKKEKIKFL